jgi:hypothetical protein
VENLPKPLLDQATIPVGVPTVETPLTIALQAVDDPTVREGLEQVTATEFTEMARLPLLPRLYGSPQ